MLLPWLWLAHIFLELFQYRLKFPVWAEGQLQWVALASPSVCLQAVIFPSPKLYNHSAVIFMVVAWGPECYPLETLLIDLLCHDVVSLGGDTPSPASLPTRPAPLLVRCLSPRQEMSGKVDKVSLVCHVCDAL